MKIAIVGQAGIGKTTLSHILQFQYPEKIVLVPDKFEIIRKEMMPEPKNEPAFKHYQRALFFFQKELEDLVCLGNIDKITFCAGSTLDVLKYWPNNLESFFDEIHSTMKAETERYDWVLNLTLQPELLDPAPSFSLLNDTNIWRHHPHYIAVVMEKEFNSTAKKVSYILQQIMEKTPYRNIQDSISKQKNATEIMATPTI